MIAKLKALWAAEPVLLAAGLSIATTIGVLTQDQATAVTNGIAGIIAGGVQVVAAFKVRSKVIPPAHDPTPLPNGDEFEMDLGPTIG